MDETTTCFMKTAYMTNRIVRFLHIVYHDMTMTTKTIRVIVLLINKQCKRDEA